MNNRGSYSQKKKKEALRRLSQSGRGGPRMPRNETRERGRDPRPLKRRQQDPIEDARRNPRRGLFGGRHVVASDSPSSSSHLVIHADLRGQSSGTDIPDTELERSRHVVTSDVSSRPAAGGLFGKVSDATAPSSIFAQTGASSGTFGSAQSIFTQSKDGNQGSPARRSLFQTDSGNLFPSGGVFGGAPISVSQNSQKGTDSAGTLYGKPISKNPFTDLTKQASSQDPSSAGVSGSLEKHSEDTPGLDNVTRNLFGKPTLSIFESASLFGKPQEKSDQSSMSSTTGRVLFGKAKLQPKDEEQSKSKDLPKPHTQTLFGKIQDQPSRGSRGEYSSKRQLSPGKPETASKRTITKFDNPFSSDSQSDITDLETFGAVARQRKPIIKRSGLFGKATAEASSGREDSPRKAYQSRSRSRSRSPEDRKQRPIPRKSWEEREKQVEESKSDQRSSRSTSRRHTFSSSEDIKNLKAIWIKNVPDEVNERSFLKNYFSNYGGVTLVFPNTKKNSAIIHFADHDSAAHAMKKVGVLKPGTEPVEIFWRKGGRHENRASQDDEKPPPTRHKDDRPTGLRQSLVPYNRRGETKVNPKDGTTRNVVARSAISATSVTRPKTSRLSVPAQLLSKQVGILAQERLNILEERNKIIRQGLKKKSHHASSQAIQGTCPDMCPEKERYMRMVQRRLHPYELHSGSTDKVNHDLAVKEYSRSSADQEEPLPHEMRPAPVLTLTMNYLMCYIMNKGQDGCWEEWFDFLWSRTRGIRKDITQQDLRDPTAIDLMEKCARFHIFCSHRLCEEDRSTIDPKINNENLTKCMQSLKHFYHDSASEGAICPNEAEFRAYDVLLNLNDRDILRQVQQYRMEVCSSEPVKFALKAFSAVSSNNYVKFFKLVRSTTYLNACIMHRYFTQVRNIALVIMNKAYTFSITKGSQFPLANIETTLAFDNQSMAAEFCQSHNLTMDDEMVNFSRTAFQEPDIPQAAERSHSVIEAKRTCSVTIGEVVNGGPLPPDVLHKATSSFDENGSYKASSVVETAAPESRGDAVLAVEESVASFEKQERSQPSIVPALLTQHVVKPPYSNAEIKEVARGMFLEVIDEMIRDLSDRFLGCIRLVRTGSLEILQDTIEGALPLLMREIAQDVCTEEQQQRRHEAALAELDHQRRLKEREMEERRQHQAMVERQRVMEQKAQIILEETVDVVLEEETSWVADWEMRIVQEQLRKRSIERCMSQLHHELVEEAVISSCRLVAAEVIQTEIELRKQRLVECEKAVVFGRIARYLHRWQKVYAKRIQMKRTLLTFPAAPPNQTASEQLRVLWPKRPERSEVTAGQVTLDTPFSIITGRERIAKSILRIHYLKNVQRRQAWSPLDLPSMLCNAFQSHHAPGAIGIRRSNEHTQHHYWKMVASLPSDGSKLICDWLKAKLQRGKVAESVRKHQLQDDDKVETLSLYSSRIPHVSVRQPCTLSICTKVITGSLDLAEQHRIRHQLLGTSGILFVLDPASSNQNYWRQAQTRLNSILHSKPTSPPLPLLIALFDWSVTEHAQCMYIESLGLRRLCEIGAVSSYQFVGLAADVEDPGNSTELKESLKWLASRCPLPPVLAEDSFKGYLDTGMTDFFSSRLYEDARERRDARLPEQACQRVIDLYNSTVRHLADVTSSSTLTSLSWPPTEFTMADRETDLPSSDWNTKQNIHRLRDDILSLTLPKLLAIREDDNWSNVCDIIQQYLTSLPGHDKTKTPLFARVHRLLDKCHRTFEDTCYLTFDAPGCQPMAGHVPWTRIIEECIDYIMASVQSHDLDNSDDVSPTIVYYIQSEFDNFEVPRSWKDAMNTTTQESYAQPQRFASVVASIVEQKQTEFAARQLEETLSKTAANQKPAPTVLETAPSYVVSATNSAEAVKVVLSSAKDESEKYEELLQKWLNGVDEWSALDGMDTLTNVETHYGVDKGSTLSNSETDHPERVPRAAYGSTLEEGLEDLRLSMEAEQRANRVTEIRLASLLAL